MAYNSVDIYASWVQCYYMIPINKVPISPPLSLGSFLSPPYNLLGRLSSFDRILWIYFH